MLAVLGLHCQGPFEQNAIHLGNRWYQLKFGWVVVRWVLAEPNKLSRIHPHGGCQTSDFVLAFAYAQTPHPHLFPASDGLGAVVIAALCSIGCAV